MSNANPTRPPTVPHLDTADLLDAIAEITDPMWTEICRRELGAG